MGKTILLIENAEATTGTMLEILEEKGYNVLIESEEVDIVNVLDNSSIALIIIDFFMLNTYSNEFKKRLSDMESVEVIMSFDLDIQRVQHIASTLNVTQILMKPLDKTFLIGRVSSILENSYNKEKNEWVYGDLSVDFHNKIIIKAGKKIELDNKPLKILKLLVLNRGIVLTRDKILDKLYGIDEIVTDSTLNGYISTIRNVLKIECIKTIRGIGYKLEY